MIITQDHIDYLIKQHSKEGQTGSDIILIRTILECINIRRKGRWENTSYILNTDKQQLVVEEDE